MLQRRETELSHRRETELSHRRETKLSHRRKTKLSHRRETELSRRRETKLSHRHETKLPHPKKETRRDIKNRDHVGTETKYNSQGAAKPSNAQRNTKQISETTENTPGTDKHNKK